MIEHIQECNTLIEYGVEDRTILAKALLNLIEKQYKEIEELKEKNKTLKSLQNDTNGLYIEMTERKNYFERELQKVEYKIKAKIEEVKDGTYDAKIVLQSLLEKEYKWIMIL